MDIAFLGQALGFLLAVGIGLGCGSYATMPYYRLPRGEACAGRWIGKKSHCVVCDAQLRTRDLIPVFNWLLTRGKCQFCSMKINPVYFFIELSITLCSVLIYLRYGFGDAQYYLLLLGLACCLVIMTATDYSFRVMPDPVFVVMVMLALPYRVLLDGQIYDMIQTFVLATLIALASARLTEKYCATPIPNYRYLKLIAIAGLWFGYGQFFLWLGVAGILFAMLTAAGRGRPVLPALAPTLPFLLVLLYA